MMGDGKLEGLKETIRTMAAIGCDREMAAKAVGWTLRQLRQMLDEDPEFEQILLRAEGHAEFQRMRNLHAATKDEKHWRAAAWWLERRAQKRYMKRSARAITTVELEELIDELVAIAFREVTRVEDRNRLATCLAAFAISLEQEAGGVLPPAVLALAEQKAEYKEETK